MLAPPLMDSDKQVGLLTGGFTVPNLITGARMSLIPVFAWAFIAGMDTTAFVLLFLIGSTDWIDGLVARRTGQVSVLGKLLDPVADRLAIVTVLLVFLFRGTLSGYLVMAILLRDVALSIAFFVLQRRGYPRLPVNWVGKTATAAIFFGVGFAMMTVAFPDFFSEKVKIISTICLMVGATLYWVAAALYLAQVRRLAPNRMVN